MNVYYVHNLNARYLWCFCGSPGLGGSVVVNLLSVMPKQQNLSVYMDNFFTSLNLLDELKQLGFNGTGTIRANRLQQCPLEDADKLKKKPRGEYDFRSDAASGLIVVRWNDNSIVNVASNHHGIQPLNTVNRWSASLKKKVAIPQPALVTQYNRGMGGTDRMDQNLNSYRINIRNKKWWWPLFAFAVDTAVCNAWYLYRCSPAAVQMPLSLLDFRRQVANTYFAKYSRRLPIGRPPSVPPAVGRHRGLDARLPADVRYDGISHHLDSIPTQHRCAVCGMKTVKICTKCQMSLHDRCFGAFHTRPQ